MTSPQAQGYSNFNPSWYQKINSNISRVHNTITSRNFNSLTAGHEIKISPNSHQFLEKLSPYQRVQISREIASLSATPRPTNSAKQKSSNNIYVITEKNTAFSISYKIYVTKIYILEILPTPKLTGKHRELPALYQVKRVQNNEWALIPSPVDNVNSTHAAINGQSNVLNLASELMGKHISEAFKNDNVSSYTLFHNPSDGLFWDTYESSQDKRHETTAVAKQFANVLKNVQKKGEHVKWVAHSQGGLIFTEAARYHWENNKTELSKNSVQFNAGANNENKSNTILKAVNIKVHDYNNHPFDPVPNIIGGNAKDWVSLLGSTVGFVFLFTGPNRSPHTNHYNGNSSVVNKVYNMKDKSALIVQSIINSLPK